MLPNKANPMLIAGLIALTVAVSGCAFGGANEPRQVPGEEAEAARVAAQERRRLRPPINTSRNLYEGSLWRGAASWGNLLRDHRARFRGDLLTVIELQKIIKVPEVKPEEQVTQPQQEEEMGAVDPILAFLRAQERRRELIELEQNEILRSIDSMEVEVVRVLANGNLLVRGVHPPIFRDSNRVKYVITLSGIVRPSDVDENNNVLAPRLSKADLKVRRLVRRDVLPLGDVARAAGRPQEGGLLDRLTNFLTGPGTGSRSTRVPRR